MRRLALGLPTAIQVDESYAILFHDGGVSEFKFLTSYLDYKALKFPPEHCSRWICVLVDSNPPESSDTIHPSLSLIRRPSF